MRYQICRLEDRYPERRLHRIQSFLYDFWSEYYHHLFPIIGGLLLADLLHIGTDKLVSILKIWIDP